MRVEVFDINYASRPSWKSHGEGRATCKGTLNSDGSLDLHAAEWPEGIRGGKEVFVTIPVEAVEALFRAIMDRKAKEVIEQVEGKT